MTPDPNPRWTAFLPKAAEILRWHHKVRKQPEGSPPTLHEQTAASRIILSWQVHVDRWEREGRKV